MKRANKLILPVAVFLVTMLLACGDSTESNPAPASNRVTADAGATDIATTPSPDTSRGTGTPDLSATDAGSPTPDISPDRTPDFSIQPDSVPTPDATAADVGGSGDALSAGACDNPDDRSAVMDAQDEMVDKITGCAIGCGLGGSYECSRDCVRDELGISESCAGCFAENILCTLDNCFFECSLDSTSDGCLSCQAENCNPAFEECAGIPAGIPE